MQDIENNEFVGRGGRRVAVELPEARSIDIEDNGFERVLRIADLIAALRLRRASIYALIRRGAFPKPIKLTGVQRGWLSSDVRRWLEDRKAERDADE
jgi:prophage regulatory protein